jgi:hypothetical protein
MTTEEKLREKVADDITRESLGITLHDTLRDLIAAKWAGKKVNKRICDQFAAALGDGMRATGGEIRVSLEYIASMCYLRCYGIKGAEKYENTIRLFLGYAGNGYSQGDIEAGRSFQYLTVPGFEENNIANGSAARNRNADRAKLLAGDELTKIARLIDTINTAKKNLAALTDYGTAANQVKYDAERLAGIRD